MSKQKRELGERAEKRVKNIFTALGAIIFDEKKIYPDFSILTINNKITGVPSSNHAVEVKTAFGYNGVDRIGRFVISRQEFDSYEKISQQNSVILVLEIRPRGYNWRNYIYIVVPWKKIHERFIKSSPDQVTLSIWWAILNGHKLKDWLEYVC